MRRESELTPNGVCQADLWSLYNPRLVKAPSAGALRRFVEMDPGLEAYKKDRYILLAFQEGCRWNNFTDDWNAQFVSEAATKLLNKYKSEK